MCLFEHAALSRDVDSHLVPAAGIEVAQPFFVWIGGYAYSIYLFMVSVLPVGGLY